ncbi:MAG: hypothetical protein AAFY88_11745, partial [Acidobacteriota bacterium]
MPSLRSRFRRPASSSPLLRRSAPLLALLGLAAGLAPITWAHSFERSFASARYAERLDAENLEVLVVVEMPSLDVLGDFRRFLRDHPDASDEENTERFRIQQLDEIAASFTLHLDGEAVEQAWRPVEHPANGLGDTDFFVYMIEHRRPAPRDRRLELELDNQLHPAKVVFMSSRAEASGGWRVLEDSAAPLLADGMEGEVVGPDVEGEASGQWSSREAMRQLRVVFERGARD